MTSNSNNPSSPSNPSGPSSSNSSNSPDNSTRGFTLIELIIALAISLVLIALSGSLIIFSMNFLNRTEVRALDKYLAEQGADYVKKRLLYAQSIELICATEPPPSISEGEVLFIGQVDQRTGKILLANEGHLYYLRAGDTEPIDVFGTDSYRGSSLAFAYRAIVDETNRTPKSFEITIKTIRDEKVSSSSKKTFSLYEAGDSTDTEPRVSTSIDSWNDGDNFDISTARFYLLINSAP